METHLLTTRELAARLRLKPSTIRSWARDERIPVERLSCRALRFDLEKVLHALRSEAPIRTANSDGGIRLVRRHGASAKKGGQS